jgi:hypothetical protein
MPRLHGRQLRSSARHRRLLGFGFLVALLWSRLVLLRRLLLGHCWCLVLCWLLGRCRRLVLLGRCWCLLLRLGWLLLDIDLHRDAQH